MFDDPSEITAKDMTSTWALRDINRS